jgi:hypothetical protein
VLQASATILVSGIVTPRATLKWEAGVPQGEIWTGQSAAGEIWTPAATPGGSWSQAA